MSEHRLPERVGDEFVIDDVESLKALADPLRIRMIGELADHARTVKELARILDVPQTRLYYHIKILERLGVIGVVSRRIVSGIEERSYQATARSTTVSPALMSQIAGTGVVAALMDMTAAELEIALADPAPVDEEWGSVPILTATKLFLSPDEVAEMQARLFGVINDYSDPEREQEGRGTYHTLLISYRSPSEVKGS